MAEKTKKAKAPSKVKKTETTVKTAVTETTGPKKVAAKKKTEVVASTPAAPVQHEEVAQLAHHYWAERGHQHGQHVDDWFRAEQELRGKAS